MKSKLALVIMVAVASAAFGIGGYYAGFKFASSEGDGAIWFENIKPAENFMEVKDAHEVLKLIRASLKTQKAIKDKLPEKLERDKAPRIVFVSVSDGRGQARTALGRGEGFKTALNDALKNLFVFLPGDYPARSVKFDLVTRVLRSIEISDRGEINKRAIDLGLTGIAFGRDVMEAFLPEEILGSELVSAKYKTHMKSFDRHLNIARGKTKPVFEQFIADKKKLDAKTFHTLGFFNDGEQTLRLYRGKEIFKSLTNEELLAAITAGGRYLAASTADNGRIVYEYWPARDTESRSYNFLRHAGTVYSMFDTYVLNKDEVLFKAAKRALDYMVSHMVPFLGREDAYCLLDGKKAKLGGAGLSLLAMAHYHKASGGDMQYVPMMQKLARYIALEQREDGQFVHMRTLPDFEKTDFVSDYYPGEAMFGLASLYEIDKNEEWLDVAEKSANYLINSRDKDKPIDKLYHDHWLLLSFDLLYRYRPKQLYLDQAMRIAEAIMRKQHRDLERPDWIGGYYRPPRSTPTSCRSEGLNAALRLVRDYNVPDMKPRMLETLHLSMIFQIQNQYRVVNAMYYLNPERLKGGVMGDYGDPNVRNDYVQHSISAKVNYYRILNEEKISLEEPSLPANLLLKKAWPFEVRATD